METQFYQLLLELTKICKIEDVYKMTLKFDMIQEIIDIDVTFKDDKKDVYSEE